MNRHPVRFSLRFKATLGIVVILFAIMGAMSFILLEKIREQAFAQREVLGRQAIVVLADAMRDPGIGWEPDGRSNPPSLRVQELIDRLDLFSAEMMDSDLRSIVRSGPIPLNSGGVERDVRAVLKEGGPRTVRRRIPYRMDDGSIQTVRTLEIIRPLRLSERSPGVVRVVLSLEDLEANLSYFWGSTIRFILIEYVVITIFIGLLISMMVIRPLERLVDVTRKIASGDLDHRVEVVTRDEIGLLAESLNRMSESLVDSRRRLEKNVSSLQNAYAELKRTQDELVFVEKLASVGNLAAGLAHEIGNPLGIILGYIEVMLMEEKEGARREHLDTMRGEVVRIEEIIRHLLDFSRPASMARQRIDVNDILRKSVALLAAHKDFRNVTIDLQLADDLPNIEADGNRLQQVFVNLFLNAGHAMASRGVMLVASSHLQEDGSERVRIVVQDEGTGIPDAVIGRIFDPFFSTRTDGSGTGLGLSICHRLVAEMNGKIRIRNRVDGPGVEVVVSFPAWVA